MKTLDDFIRPSSLAAIAECEGRPTMEAAVVNLYGEPPASGLADMGHDLHRRSQLCVDGWKLCQETGERGASWGDSIADTCNEAAEDGLDSWSISCLQTALEMVRDLIEKYGIEPENVLTEHGLDMASLGFTRGGTADLVLVDPFKLAVVIDYKYGYVDQGDADEHDQTQAYAAATAETFDVPEVIVYLIQPRAEKGHKMTAAKYGAETLRKNRAWTAAVIRLAHASNPQLKAAYPQCVYCRALGRCEEARRKIMEAQEALAALGRPMDGEAMADLIDTAKLAEAFAEQGKELGRAWLQAGNRAPGWKLGNPRAIRSVIEPATALATLQDAGISAVQLALEDAITIKAAKLPKPAAELIANHISETLSQPPVVQDKASKRGAA